jgi:L-gulono-1,4-lactone dehydrogenase
VATTERRWTNWAGTASCTPRAVHFPASEDEIAAIVKAAERVKVVGAGHSFSDIACTDGDLIRLDRYDKVLAVDRAARTVTAQAGITISRLNEELAVRGLAMQNLGDIAYQSLAGAIATATHGTGTRLGTISTQVRELTLVTADGSGLRCSPDADAELFRAAQVSLGALGVIASVTLACVDAFNLHATEGPGRLDEILSRIDELADSNDHFEFYWFPHTDRVLVKVNNRTDEPARPRSRPKEWFDEIFLANKVFGVLAKTGERRPSLIPRISRVVTGALSKTEYSDRSDRVFASPRLVRFAETEYEIPRSTVAGAVREVHAMIEREGFRVNFPIEVRFVAADDALLSPAHRRDSCYVAAHMSAGLGYEPYFRAFERIMDARDGRPHWGKIHFQTAATLRARYPEWDRFIAVRNRLDPERRFGNTYLQRVLGP